MVKEFLAIILFIFLLFFFPMIPCIAIWYLLGPIGFVEMLLTLLFCMVIYVPCWVLWLAVLIVIVECK